MADAGSLPFREQSEFFRRKLNLPTQAWTDIFRHEHDYAFVVAGANRNALLEDFREAVEKAINNGTTLEDFRKDFDAIVERHGWNYHGGRAWRSRVIYETNLNSSYQAGRWKQLQAAKKLQPYWEYRHSDSVMHPRPHHVAWDGLVLDADDPWWKTHFPPNGWGCQCRVFALSAKQLQKLGKRGPDKAPEVAYETKLIGQRSPGGPREVQVPEGIDPGFDYAPGAARLKSEIPPERPGGAETVISGAMRGYGLPNLAPDDDLPTPRGFDSSRLLPESLGAAEYAKAFLAPLGATLESPAIVRDVMGEALVVGREMFSNQDGSWKANKFNRGKYLPMISRAMLDPDEIWARIEWNDRLQKAMVRRRYIARFSVDGADMVALTVFDWGSDGWGGVTAFRTRSTNYADTLRLGVRLYKREP